MFISKQWVEQNFTVVEEVPEKENIFYVEREGEYFSLSKNVKMGGRIVEELILDISLVYSRMGFDEFLSTIKRASNGSEIFISAKGLENFNGFVIKNTKSEKELSTQKEDISELWRIRQQKNAKTG